MSSYFLHPQDYLSRLTQNILFEQVTRYTGFLAYVGKHTFDVVFSSSSSLCALGIISHGMLMYPSLFTWNLCISTVLIYSININIDLFLTFNGMVYLLCITSQEQLANIFTRSHPPGHFLKLIHKLKIASIAPS